MRASLEKIKDICTRKASPPIPYVVRSPSLYVVHIDDLENHKRLAILALLLDRDETHLNEAKVLLKNLPEPMEICFDLAEIYGKIRDHLEPHLEECESCQEHWDEDHLIVEKNYDVVESDYEAHLKLMNQFTEALQGRYHVDFNDFFPTFATNNHDMCMAILKDSLSEQDPDDYVILMEAGSQVKRLGRGIPAFCKELIESI